MFGGLSVVDMNDQKHYIAQATPTIGGASTVQSTQKISPQEGGNPPPPTGGYMQLFFPVILIAVLYFLLIRPQQRKEKEKREMIKRLKKGDKVITRGGIWGVITGLKSDEGICVLKIADKVNIEISTNAIEMLNPQAEKIQNKKKS